MIAVSKNLGKRLEELGTDLAGRSDALAVYIRLEPDLDYWDRVSELGDIAGPV